MCEFHENYENYNVRKRRIFVTFVAVFNSRHTCCSRTLQSRSLCNGSINSLYFVFIFNIMIVCTMLFSGHL